MAKRSKANFTANVDGQFPTNGTGQIGANRVRSNLGEDIPASFVNVVDDLQLFTVVTGTDAYVLPADIISYATGYAVLAKFTNGSTGACTVDANGIGAKKLFINPTTQAGVGDVVANQIYLLIYDAALDTAAGGFLMIGSGSAGAGGSSLTRVSFDTSVATPSMDMAEATDKIFVGSATVNANKELVFANAGAIIRATTFLTVSGSRAITVPANVLTDTSKWTWSKPATKLIWAAESGVYRLQWTYDGTNFHLDIYGLYTNVI